MKTLFRLWMTVCVFALLGLTASSAHAATRIFMGGTSGDIELASNYPGGVVPTDDTTSDELVISATATNQPVLTKNRSLNKLTFAKTTGGSTLGGNFTLTLGSGGIDNSANISGTNTIGTAAVTGPPAVPATNPSLVLAAPQTFTSGTGGTLRTNGTINNGGFLLSTSGGANIFAGVISGTGGFTSGSAVGFTAANTYNGVTTINSGASIIINGGAGAITNSSITNDGTFFIGRSTTVANAISGTGIVSSSGTLAVLTGVNTYSGGTTITAGQLNINSDAALGATGTTITFAAATTLQATTGTSITLNNRNIVLSGAAKFDPNGGTLTANGVISGSGALAVSTSANAGTSGTLVLAGTNTYTGATTIPGVSTGGGAVLRLTNPAGLGATSGLSIGSVGNSETSRLELALTGTNTINRNITTNGRNATNATVQNISGNNTLTGTFTEGSGGANAVFQSDTGAGNKLTLSFTGASSNTRGVLLQGDGNGEATVPLFSTMGGLTKSGTGTWIISGNNGSSSGTTTVNTGTLQIGNGGGTGTLGTGAVTVTDALVINRTGTTVVPGALNGAGTVTVNAGTLQVGSVNVTPFPSLTVNNGGGFTFVPNSLTASTQTFTLSNLTLANGSTIGAGLGNTPATSAVINVTNPATANGTITVKPFAISGATPTNGDYIQVTDPSGGLLNTNASTATYVAASGVINTSFTVAATDTEVRVTGVVATPASLLYWKGGQVPGAGNSWSARSGATTNWTTDVGGTTISPVVPTSITDVFISAAGATLQDQMVLGADFSIKSLTVADTNPVLLQSGNTLSIDTAGTTINAGAGAVTLSPVIAGAGGVAKNSSALLTLTAANTYTGATTVGAGILNISNATGLGTAAAGTSVASNATLQLQGGITVSAEALTLNGAGATGQSGALVNLIGSNTYNGTVTLGSASAISSDVGNLSLFGTTSITGAFDLTFTGAGTGEVRNVIATGVGAVIKNGIGTWLVNRASTSPSASNTYTGGTSVLQGDLTEFGTSSLPLSTGAVSVSNGATLRIRDKAAIPSVPNNFTISGNGITTGTGATAVSNGAIDFVNSGITSPDGLTGTITLAGDTLLRTDATQANIDFRGLITGTGNLTLVKSSGTTNTTKFKFSGANDYVGSTTLGGGLNFELGTGNNIPDASNLIFNGATLRTGGFNETAGTLSVISASTLDLGAGNSIVKFSAPGTINAPLSITNYSGTSAGGGTDQVFVGTSQTLTPAQLAQISFVSPNAAAQQLTTGEIVPAAPAAISGAIISEFRLHGAMGSADEYVELYNTTGAPLNISGWSIQTNGGAQTTLVPANSVIPAKGHFLFTGTGYSLGGYGTSDASITSDIADTSGIALFNAEATPVQKDAAGFTASGAGFKEGSGIAGAPTADGEYAFVRNYNGSTPKDSNDNAADFSFVSTAGTAITGAGTLPQLGAPSPEGLGSPVYGNSVLTTTLLNGSVSQNLSPNRVRVLSGNQGYILVRRNLTNKTGKILNRVRFTVTSITALNSPLLPGNNATTQADVRLVTTPAESITVDGASVPVSGTTLEATPTGTTAGPAQLGGGGFNSSTSFDAVLTTPLGIGEKRAYVFRLNVIKSGNFNVLLNIEALPAP